MKRGDLVTVVLSGDYDKPRPALIIQSDLFPDHPSVTLHPVTSVLRPTPLFRITIEPSPTNGLIRTSQIMVDKCQTIARPKAGSIIGRADDGTLRAVTRALTVFLGFA